MDKLDDQQLIFYVLEGYTGNYMLKLQILLKETVFVSKWECICLFRNINGFFVPLSKHWGCVNHFLFL